jgi:hypothetical protein
MKDILKNITRGKITSLLGIIIILAAVVSVFTKGASWTDVAAGAVIGLALLGLPDPRMPGGPTGGGTGMGAVGVLALAVALVGCVTYQKCQDKYGTQGPSVTIAVTDSVKVPVTITTPADSLAAHFELDSLNRASVHDTLRLVSVGSRVEVELWKSPPAVPGGSQRLNARVKVPPQVIHDTVTRTVTIYGKCPPSYTFAPDLTWYQRGWDYYRTACTYLFSLGVVLYFIGRAIKRRIP